MGYFQAVLVDIDGTTVDCEKRNRNVLEELAFLHGGKIIPDDWKKLAGTSDRFIHDWLRQSFKQFTVAEGDFVAQVKQGYLRRAFEVAARDGMIDNFNHIRKRKLPLAAVTNSPTNIALANLDAAKCTHYMDFIQTSDDVEAAGQQIKPAPDPYLMAAKRIGVDSRRCLVFEDSATGVKSGVAAGCIVVQIVDEPAMKCADAHFHVYDALELRQTCWKLLP